MRDMSRAHFFGMGRPTVTWLATLRRSATLGARPGAAPSASILETLTDQRTHNKHRLYIYIYHIFFSFFTDQFLFRQNLLMAKNWDQQTSIFFQLLRFRLTCASGSVNVKPICLIFWLWFFRREIKFRYLSTKTKTLDPELEVHNDTFFDKPALELCKSLWQTFPP